jgi:CHASE2 domain-containing sensor protein
MNERIPEPTERERVVSRRLLLASRACSVLFVLIGAPLFLVEWWPRWAGYLAGALGLVSWLLYVRSMQELRPPGKDPFGGGRWHER